MLWDNAMCASWNYSCVTVGEKMPGSYRRLLLLQTNYILRVYSSTNYLLNYKSCNTRPYMCVNCKAVLLILVSGTLSLRKVMESFVVKACVVLTHSPICRACKIQKCFLYKYVKISIAQSIITVYLSIGWLGVQNNLLSKHKTCPTLLNRNLLFAFNYNSN